MGKDKRPPLGERAAKLAREMSRPGTDDGLAGMYDAEHARIAQLAAGVEAHEYKVSFTGMCCGAMVMRDGSGDACGLPYGHSLHVDLREDRAAKEASEAPGPLAEIQERKFTYEGEMLQGGVIATALENATSALYQRVALAKFTPADGTLTVDIGPGIKRGGIGTSKLTVALSVRAWKAVEL